jgi:hypothetical protein
VDISRSLGDVCAKSIGLAVARRWDCRKRKSAGNPRRGNGKGLMVTTGYGTIQPNYRKFKAVNG